LEGGKKRGNYDGESKFVTQFSSKNEKNKAITSFMKIMASKNDHFLRVGKKWRVFHF
jgi:hypothetical protein